MNAGPLCSKFTISICMHTVNQVVNGYHSLSSRLSVTSGYMIFLYSQLHCVSLERFVVFVLTEDTEQ